MNSPSSVTLSGEAGPLEELAALLEARGVFCRFLKVRYAFHSAQMDPIRDELLAALDGHPAAAGELAPGFHRHRPPDRRARARSGILVGQRPPDGPFRRRGGAPDRARM